MQNLVPIDHSQRYIDCSRATRAAEPRIVGVDKDEMKQCECGGGRVLLRVDSGPRADFGPRADSGPRAAEGSDWIGDEKYCEKEKEHYQSPRGSLHRGRPTAPQ